jgi:SPP1 gp7 family putative phage head morphogenesis protein
VVLGRLPDLAAALRTASNEGEAIASLKEWASKAIEGDHALVSTLWRADMQSNMAGQLFVRDVEFGARKVALAPDIYDRAFLELGFAEALDYFESRELMSPEAFRALLDDERVRAWSLSRGISETVVRDAAERIRKAMAGDGSQMSDFIEQLSSGVDAEGYPGGVRRYLEMAFRTTNATSYNAGRMTQQSDPVVAEAFAEGGWMYLTADDNRVRDTHAPLNLKQWRYSDPEARRAYPPNGYQCRCVAILVDADELDPAQLSRRVDVGAAITPGFAKSPMQTIREEAD